MKATRTGSRPGFACEEEPEASGRGRPAPEQKKGARAGYNPRPRPASKPPAEKKTTAGKKARLVNGPVKGTAAPAAPGPSCSPRTLPELKVIFATDPEPVLEAIRIQRRSGPDAVQLALQAYRLSFRTSYDQLLCLPTLSDVRSLWYQEDTARKVMKNFRGRPSWRMKWGWARPSKPGSV